jgi:hypothetical protein
MFDFLKPVVGVPSSDWAVYKGEVLKVAEAIGQRFRDNEEQIQRLAAEVRSQEAQIELLRAQHKLQQAQARQPFAQKLRGKGKP